MVAGAREEAAEAGVDNVTFEAIDVQAASFADTYDYAFGRFGTMFFANPVVALRNVRHALRPGGRLNMVVWRRKLDNEWLNRAETIVEQFLDRPDEYDEPTCGPGPFSMANADTVTDVLKHAGYEDIELKRQDLVIKTGDSLEHAVEVVMPLGPAGEVLRLGRPGGRDPTQGRGGAARGHGRHGGRRRRLRRLVHLIRARDARLPDCGQPSHERHRAQAHTKTDLDRRLRERGGLPPESASSSARRATAELTAETTARPGARRG